MISIIVACDPLGVIGRDDTIPWHFPDDLRHFKNTTLNHPIVMGRATYESLPHRPLRDRTNVVLTRDPDYHARGSIVMRDIKAALKLAQTLDHEIYVIGGAIIYRDALPFTDRIVLTRIKQNHDGNRFFLFDEADWQIEKTLHQGEDFDIVSLIRKIPLTDRFA